MRSTAPAQQPPRPAAAGRFTHGPIMRHVAVMTLSGALGLTLMFLVDAATLLYIAMLGDEALTAAVGFAWTVQFFIVSVGLAATIAATALVSRALGGRDRAAARDAAVAAFAVTFVVLAGLSALAALFRVEILASLGAEGRALEAGADFLLISAPSMPLMGIAMVSGSVLRAAGDAKRAMLVTSASAAVSVFLDPLMIFSTIGGLPIGAGWGIEGAAAAMNLARMASCGLGLWGVVKVHDLCARPGLEVTRANLRPLMAIAGPATLTQLSTPFGNFLLTEAVARHGEAAMAGWAVTARLSVLAFGGIFALSAAVGGIFGQNFGAHDYARVRRTWRDGVLFCGLYVLAAWAVLALLTETAIEGFALPPEGAAVVRAFSHIGALGFLFAGWMFVANAAFNVMGKPIWSSGVNWARDGAFTGLAILIIGGSLGAAGAVYAQMTAMIAAGCLALWLGGRFTARLGGGAAAGWGAAPVAPSARAGAAAGAGRASGMRVPAPGAED